MSLAGKERVLYPPGENLVLHDLLPDGRLLVERAITRLGIVMRSPGMEREREMSWLDGSSRPILSADGSTLVFTESQAKEGDPKGASTSGRSARSPLSGSATAGPRSLSPDGKWVTSIVPGPPPELVLLPTGAGTARKDHRSRA